MLLPWLFCTLDQDLYSFADQDQAPGVYQAEDEPGSSGSLV